MYGKKPYQKVPKVHIDPRGMTATLAIARPAPDEEAPNYTVAELLEVLSDAGVGYGIDQEMLITLTKELVYDKAVVVAQGQEPEEGENGYYEYHFSQDFSKKPKIREDGSADFLSIKVVEVVREDDLIATYHPAVPGKNGISVRSMPVEPRRVRDMPALAGRGFHRGEDGIHYYSDMDGKIVMKNSRIMISPVLEIEGDADMTVGNLEFKGDVVVYGGVKHGIYIHATGSITVHGLVEHCYLDAGRDIFLLSGVKGGEKTTIRAEGSITAEFIEYAIVSCKKELRAAVLFNCLVNCDSKIYVTNGQRAGIIGGVISAVQGVAVLNLGNSFGTVTKITVGLDDERMKEIRTLTNKIEALTQNITKIKKGISDFDEASEKKGISYKDDPRRLQLLRVKIRDEAIVAEDRVRLEELYALVEAGKKATVRVYNTVYAGVTIRMTDQYVQMSDYQRRVEFVKTETGIRLEPLVDEDLEDF